MHLKIRCLSSKEEERHTYCMTSSHFQFSYGVIPSLLNALKTNK